jgi:DNA-directed RNA polymerase specialized sigma24 family protein
MPHALDKETVNRILHLHKVQGLSPQIIAQRFGFSTGRIHGVIRRQAASSKPQAPSALKKTQLNDIG